VTGAEETLQQSQHSGSPRRGNDEYSRLGAPAVGANGSHGKNGTAESPTPEEESFARLVDAATLARELDVSRAWVYNHADELGAIPLGAGERPRLLFDLERAQQTAQARLTGRSPRREP
jgi:hypothetical protein